MIVRILGEGQFEVPESAHAELDRLDGAVEAAVDQSDEAAFKKALEALIAEVRAAGTPLEASRIVPSDLAVPSGDASLAEVRELLGSEAPADN